MDYVQILHGADRMANVLRRAGLGRLTRAGRSVLERRIRKSLTVEADGLQLSGGIEHRGYLYRCSRGNVEAMTRKLFRETVAPGTFVLDVGAHLGLYALIAAREAGEGGSVYAFEPDPRTFPWLVRNVAANGFTDRIATLQKAVSDGEGDKHFFLDESTPAASRLVGRAKSNVGTTASCVTIDGLLPSNARVDVVKLDVEGAELEALRGMARTLALAPNSLTLFLEVHPGALRARGESPQAVLAEVEAVDLRAEVIDEAGGAVRPLTARDLAGKPVNLRCSRT